MLRDFIVLFCFVFPSKAGQVDSKIQVEKSTMENSEQTLQKK